MNTKLKSLLLTLLKLSAIILEIVIVILCAYNTYKLLYINDEFGINFDATSLTIIIIISIVQTIALVVTIKALISTMKVIIGGGLWKTSKSISSPSQIQRDINA